MQICAPSIRSTITLVIGNHPILYLRTLRHLVTSAHNVEPVSSPDEGAILAVHVDPSSLHKLTRGGPDWTHSSPR